jgi:hypothetical protein
MAKLNINVGASDNDKTGDILRTAFTKVNANFAELYTLTGGTAADLRELAQDYAALMFTHASHTNITATYDDANNKILLTGVASAVWPVTNTAGASGPTKIAIGVNAGLTSQAAGAVAIGNIAGVTNQGQVAVAIGMNAGNQNQGGWATAVGSAAGYNAQGTYGVAVGYLSGYTGQGSYAVAVGAGSANGSQGANAVAVGYQAGNQNQGAQSIAIGADAGATSQAANTIILNATGSAVNGVSAQTDSFYVAPIRNSGATSGYATKRVLQYNETTKEITYSNTLDAVRPYITGYGSEIHVSPVAVDDTGNGTIGDPVKTIARAQALAALAFETTAAGSRKTIVLHPGDYVEDVTISTQYTVLTTHELVGKNTTLTGTLTITKGCTIDGLKMTNLVVSATSATGSVDIIGCTVTTATTKTSTAYTVFRGCDLSSSTLSITGGGTTALIGGNYFTLAVNNAAAGVLAKTIVSMGPVTLTLGTLQLSDTLIYSATNTSYAITQSAYSVLTINNCQTLIPDLSNVSRISLNGFYSILSAVYDKPNSILAALSASGGSLNSIIYDQYINADRLILSSGGRITFPDATYQTTAWKGIPGPYADDAAAAAASVAVGNPYHKTGTSGQVFVRLA